MYEIIAARIADGTYRRGMRIPSVRGLQEEFGIAVTTGQKVMDRLRDDGLIYTEQGLGSFAGPPPDDESPAGQ